MPDQDYLNAIGWTLSGDEYNQAKEDTGLKGSDIISTGTMLQQRFGFNWDEIAEYKDYFTPLSIEMLEATQRGNWADYEGFLKENVNQSFENTVEDIGLNRKSQVLSSRRTMGDVLRESNQIGSNFVGSGASFKAMQRSNEDIRREDSLRVEMASLDKDNAYLNQQKGLFGVEQDVLGKMADAKSTIYDWLNRQQSTALQIKQMNLQG